MSLTMTHSLTTIQAQFRRPSVFRRLLRRIETWRNRVRERRTLASFDQRELSDLGLSRWEIEREIARHFWDI